MKFGVFFEGIRPDALIEAAQKAEALGYESLWRPDHLVLPPAMSDTYPYTNDGRAPMSTDWPIIDGFTALTFVAAVTSRIRLGTSVYILPLRNPFVTARTVVSLDFLSKGRAILGVGVGWLPEEFAIVGEEFRTRGARADECIQILRTLWTDRDAEFHGRHYSFDAVRFEPKPVSKPHPPILVGGESDAALRRAAAYGDGWYGHHQRPDQIRAQLSRLAELRRQYGRETTPFEITLSAPADITAGEVREREELGVQRLVVKLWTSTRDAIPALEGFRERQGISS